MKRTIAAVCILLISSIAYAHTAVTKFATGTVIRVSHADPVKEIPSEVMLIDKNNKENLFLIKATTLFYDPEWKPMRFNMLSKGSLIKVKYTTTKEGINVALTVNVLKKQSAVTKRTA